MQTSTGHLVNSELYDELKKAGRADDYEPVPQGLVNAANKKLSGRSEAYVSTSSGGKLAKWARARNAEKKRAARQAMAKASRKANRGRR